MLGSAWQLALSVEQIAISVVHTVHPWEALSRADTRAESDVDVESPCKMLESDLSVPVACPTMKQRPQKFPTLRDAVQCFDMDSHRVTDEILEKLEEQALRHIAYEEQKVRVHEMELQERRKRRADEAIARTERRQARLHEFLAKNGFKHVNSRVRRRVTYRYPLHVAVKRNNAEIVELLLKARADPTLVNSMGRTPNMLALELDSGGSHTEVIALLR